MFTLVLRRQLRGAAVKALEAFPQLDGAMVDGANRGVRRRAGWDQA